jgi:hypothetical protein
MLFDDFAFPIHLKFAVPCGLRGFGYLAFILLFDSVKFFNYRHKYIIIAVTVIEVYRNEADGIVCLIIINWLINF